MSSLMGRRGFLRAYEQASYAAIGRKVVEGLSSPHRVCEDVFEVWVSPLDQSLQSKWFEVEG